MRALRLAHRSGGDRFHPMRAAAVLSGFGTDPGLKGRREGDQEYQGIPRASQAKLIALLACAGASLDRWPAGLFQDRAVRLCPGVFVGTFGVLGGTMDRDAARLAGSTTRALPGRNRHSPEKPSVETRPNDPSGEQSPAALRRAGPPAEVRTRCPSECWGSSARSRFFAVNVRMAHNRLPSVGPAKTIGTASSPQVTWSDPPRIPS